MLIKINKCSLICGWYRDFVGMIIEVQTQDKVAYYDGDFYVLKKDCELVDERKQHE